MYTITYDIYIYIYIYIIVHTHVYLWRLPVVDVPVGVVEAPLAVGLRPTGWRDRSDIIQYNII